MAARGRAAGRLIAVRVLYHYDAGPALRHRLAALAADGIHVEVCSERDDTRLFSLLADTEVLWHCLRPVDAAVMAAAPRLRLIQKIGVGLNTIDLECARARDIRVCNLPGSNSQAVAEHTLALMLAVLRKVATFDRLVRAGSGWTRPPELEDTLGELAGRRVGLVGAGAVPQRLAPVLAALGAEVCYANRSPNPALAATRLPLSDLLERCQVVSLHLPLTASTQRLLDAVRLRCMQPGAILVNTARGGLVDMDALAAVLTAGHLGGAGLDVFEPEPLPADHPLTRLDNVVLTPHVAWLTQETLAHSVTVAAENCRRLAGGAPLLHQVV